VKFILLNIIVDILMFSSHQVKCQLKVNLRFIIELNRMKRQINIATISPTYQVNYRLATINYPSKVVNYSRAIYRRATFNRVTHINLLANPTICHRIANYKIRGLANYKIKGLANYKIKGLANYRGLANYKIKGLVNYRTKGCPTYLLSNRASSHPHRN
jgi:hypothetical protein